MASADSRHLICLNGFRPRSGDVNEDIEYLLAVTDKNEIVRIEEYLRISVGAGGTGESTSGSESYVWDSHTAVQGPAGLYDMLVEYRATVDRAAAARSNKRDSNRVRYMASTLPHQMLDDPELLEEILAEGLESWLTTYKF